MNNIAIKICGLLSQINTKNKFLVSAFR